MVCHGAYVTGFTGTVTAIRIAAAAAYVNEELRKSYDDSSTQPAAIPGKPNCNQPYT